MQDNIYDAQFRGNILSIGKTGCRKTHFVQKLVLNNFFGRIVKIEWVSSIPLSKSREAEREKIRLMAAAAAKIAVQK